MKISLQWLRDWVDIDGDINAVSHALTMAGLEIEGIHAAAPAMSGIVVAEVTSIERHPDAEKLAVCRVFDGQASLQIVCGAPNVRAGMKAALAQVGATLPDGKSIAKAKLRGIESFGMLCSARELGLSEESSGLLELPSQLEAGKDLIAALALDDRILEINLTPNRGDCMSVAGIAREAAAISHRELHAPTIAPVPATINAVFPVRIDASDACKKYAGRVICGVRGAQQSPLWLRERLRRAGLRPISLLVDVTNYLVLELGQPMHAYDLSKLHGGIAVRTARAQESLELLDGRTIEMGNDVLVIADDRAAVGLAGIMGGQASAISDSTCDVFLEAAHFYPDAIAGRARRYGLVTDASQRFERGVDPELPAKAIERATALILEYAGGQAGPVTVVESKLAKQSIDSIRLRLARVNKILGIELKPAAITDYLQRLGMQLRGGEGEWQVSAPSWRFDINIEADLIEEIARLHGYDNIPAIDAKIAQQLSDWTESSVPIGRAADMLSDRGYQEAITYSFVDAAWQRVMFPQESSVALLNPISAELGVMRVSLWPGLAQAVRDNLHRQQTRVRLFEVGRKFIHDREIEVVAGIAVGSALPEQWDVPNRKIDFYDVKADVESLLRLSGDVASFGFESAAHSALHPGQSTRILRNGTPIGWLGAVHPEVAKRLDLTYPAFVFELEAAKLLAARLPEFAAISRYPAIRRDLAVIVDEAIDFNTLRNMVTAKAGNLLVELVVLSVYRGEPIDKGKKSIALGLNLQDTSRTLTDDDADRIMMGVTEQLQIQVGAVIRDK